MALSTSPAAPTRKVRVAIIGAGFGGLGTAMRLGDIGMDDFVILERSDDIGGTWHVNTYPGAQCDIPSILYSFSFAPNPNWTRLYPLQPEINAYLHDCVEKFGIGDRIRLGHEVKTAFWDDDKQVWNVVTDHGTWEAQFLVGGMGPFSEPSVPQLPGLDTFEGEVFHTSRWNHDHDLSGERVAIIGTGASAVQIIPQVQPIVESLTVFQRTPTWILPHPDQPMTGWPSTLFERLPMLQKATRKTFDLGHEAMTLGMLYKPALLRSLAALGRTHMRRQVKDPVLRSKLVPQFAFGCKRPTFSNKYYPALASPNVDVVTQGITEVVETGVVTADGAVHEVDSIVMGTGFRMTDNPAFDLIKGADGRSLSEVWNGSAEAYLGTTIAGFPNFFMMLGPNSVVYTSQVVTIEAQVNYILSSITEMDKKGLRSIDVRPEVQKKFVEETDERLAGSVWNSGGCSSYYKTDGGRNFTFFPGFNSKFRARTRNIDLNEYVTEADGSAGIRTVVDEKVRTA